MQELRKVIMAGIFGFVINDQRIRNLGIKVELISLFLCVFIGFVLGLLYVPLASIWSCSRHEQFPTKEMITRSELKNLATGVFIAIPSGAGVALGVLGAQWITFEFGRLF